MDPYVIAGYGVTLLALGAYALRILRRGRALAQDVPPPVRAPASEEQR